MPFLLTLDERYPCADAETEWDRAAIRQECTGNKDPFLAFAAAGRPAGWNVLASPPPPPDVSDGLPSAWAHAYLSERTANCAPDESRELRYLAPGALGAEPSEREGILSPGDGDACDIRFDHASPDELVRLARHPEASVRARALGELQLDHALTLDLVLDRLQDGAWCDGGSASLVPALGGLARWHEQSSVAAWAAELARDLPPADQAAVVATVAAGSTRVPASALASLAVGDDPAVRTGLLSTYALATHPSSPAWVAVAAFRDPRDVSALAALPDALFLAAVARFPDPAFVSRLTTMKPVGTWYAAALAFDPPARDALVADAVSRAPESRRWLASRLEHADPAVARPLWERWLEAPWAAKLPVPELRAVMASWELTRAGDLYAIDERRRAAAILRRLAHGPAGPIHDAAAWNLGIIRAELGDARGAACLLEPLLRTLPTHQQVDPMAFLANTWWVTGHLDEARALSLRLRALSPSLWRQVAFAGEIVAPYVTSDPPPPATPAPS